ncbi:hypothetical protein A5741_05725 [Mycolicibacterium conceptionense]|nr:hypothetical protein A5741_05725 [Mycolicibacterium conceptionense]
MNATDNVAKAIETNPITRAIVYQRRNLLSSMVIEVMGGCPANRAPATPSSMPGPTPGGTAPVPPPLTVCATW